MKNLKTTILTACLAICYLADVSAQEAARGKTKGKVTTAGRPGSIIAFGGGTSMPGSKGKDKAFLSNSIAINADAFFSLISKPEGNFSFGLNFGGAFNFGGNGGFGVTSNPFAVTGQTSSVVADKGTDPAQAGFRMGAGPQVNFYFGKFLVSPMVLGEYFSMTRKEMNVVQTTQFNGQSYDFNLATLPETKTSGFSVTPKLRLHYMISEHFGLFAEASYTMGPKIETTVSKLVPLGASDSDGNYELQALQFGSTMKGETQKTSFKALGLNVGLVIGLGKNGLKGWNGKSQKMTKADSGMTNGVGKPKDWNGKTKMDVPNTGVLNNELKISVLGNGETTSDGTPVVSERKIIGNIQGLKEPAEIRIEQKESNDIGMAQTNSTGDFEVTLGIDTIHKIFVNGIEFGKIKIITDEVETNLTKKSSTCDCGTWNPIISFELHPLGLFGGSFTNQTMVCGGTFNLNLGNAVNIASTNFNCLGACTAYTRATVYKDGVVMPSLVNVNLGTIAEQQINQCGDYRIELMSKCVGTNEVSCPDICVLNFHVPCDDNQINCCLNGQWDKISFIKENGVATQIICGSNIGLLKCNKSFQINATYFCNQQCQPNTAQLKYQIFKSDGTAYSTSIIASSGSPVTLTSPSVSGSFYLLLEAMCGTEICKSCIFNFKTECNQQNDCCKGRFWKEQPKIYNSAGILIETLNCPATFSLNIKNEDCKETYTIKNGVFACGSPNCPSKIMYTLTNTITGTSVSTTNSFTINPSLPNGSYVMKITAFCGPDSCQTCSFQIKKDCQPIQQDDCCKGGDWLNHFYSISSPLIKTMPVNINCGEKYNIDFIENGSITFNADYLCNPALVNCYKQIIVNIKRLGTSFNVTQLAPYTLPLYEAGTYEICYSAQCGNVTCATCCYTITINEKKDCCKGSGWIKKSIDWSNITKVEWDKDLAKKLILPPGGPIDPLPNNSSINLGECNSSYKLSLGGTYTFNADYNCVSKDCPKIVKVTIKGSTSSLLDGVYTAPISKTITVAGDYQITYDAYCGDILCSSCVFYVGCEPNCCQGAKWKSADYQIVNKKADGTWDWVPGINPIGNSIPTLKADLGIDISNLNFSCGKGCSTQYIVRRLNQNTGTLAQPDETLSIGQITTSVYSKPYPQIIIITPLCGGQKCNPLIFRVECLNKNCCVMDKITFSTGMTTSGSVATGPEPQWYSAIPLGILSPGTAPLFGTGVGTGGSATILQNQVNVAGITTYQVNRDINVSKNCIISFDGLLGISSPNAQLWTTLFQRFELRKGSSTGPVVWSHASVPQGIVGTYATNSFSGSVAVTPGVYTFVFVYNRATVNWNQNSIFVTGQITGNILLNSPECCSISNSSSGSTSAQLGNIEDLQIVENFKNCGGIMVDLLTSFQNCGACGNHCPTTAFKAETIECINGKCTVTKCQDGYADVDGLIHNGCEVIVPH